MKNSSILTNQREKYYKSFDLKNGTSAEAKIYIIINKVCQCVTKRVPSTSSTRISFTILI